MKSSSRYHMLGFLGFTRRPSSPPGSGQPGQVVTDASPSAAEAQAEPVSSAVQEDADDPHRHRVGAADLLPGMYVCELDRTWESTPFSAPGLPLHNHEDVASVRQHCEYVYVDTARHFEAEPAAALRDFSMPPAEGAQRYPKRRIDRQQLRRAKHCYRRASAALQQIFSDCRRGEALDGALIRELVASCVRSMLDNPDPLTWLTRLGESQASSAEHALNVSILSINFGRYLGLPHDELENLGVSAMLHDAGLLRAPVALLEQAEMLSREEYQQLQDHAVHGRDLLLDTPGVYPGAADVAWCHHESWDGTGYPRRLRGAQIPLFAQIVALADCYEAVVAPRPYQAPRASLEALRLIHAKRGARFEPRLALRFIECIGIYPPGVLVQMDTGEIGVVLSATRDKLRPRLALLRDSEGEPIKPRVVNLHLEAANGDDWKIRQQLPVGSHDIDPRACLDAQLLMRGRRTLARPIDIVL